MRAKIIRKKMQKTALKQGVQISVDGTLFPNPVISHFCNERGSRERRIVRELLFARVQMRLSKLGNKVLCSIQFSIEGV